MLFEPGLSMSVMLKVVGTDVAHRYGLTVEDEAPHRSGNDVRAATLWLRPFSSERDSQALRPGELLLIPALYYVPEHVETGEGSGSEWHIPIRLGVGKTTRGADRSMSGQGRPARCWLPSVAERDSRTSSPKSAWSGSRISLCGHIPVRLI
jgi:hypothetical protein